MKAAYAPTGKRSVAGTGTSTGSGSSGVEFKRIIASFCHVLVACKLVTPDCLIGPEQLRLAKFNQDGVVCSRVYIALPLSIHICLFLHVFVFCFSRKTCGDC